MIRFNQVLFCVVAAIGSFLTSTAQSTIDARAIYQDASLFGDLSYTKLASGVRAKELRAIKSALLRPLAEQLLEGRYDPQYRVAQYRAVPSAEAIARKLKLGAGFSRYQGVTGMYLLAGENVVMVGPTQGKKLQLMAPWFLRKPAPGVKPTEDPNGWGLHCQEFDLHEGLNVIRLDRASNVYINYTDADPVSAPAITVHFITGQVNGYFDLTRGDTNAQWDQLLDNAVSEVVDVKGRYSQVAYPVAWFNAYARGQGVELIESYDKILAAQYQLLGFEKYNRMPENLIFARVNYNYYMFRDGDGVAYLGDSRTMGMVVSPKGVLTKGSWGFSHEAGHVLQASDLTWGGMIEVSNNILALYATLAVGNGSALLRHNNYTTAREVILDKGISFMQDKELFDRIVPFWQLYLYFSSQGYADFYPDLFEYFRATEDPSLLQEGSGQSKPKKVIDGKEYSADIDKQFLFVKAACDIGKTDLTEFFERWGFFKTGHIQVDDYGIYDYCVTPEQVAEVKAYIASKKYSKPLVDLTLLQDTY